MKFCPNCGASAAEEEKFCQSCGTPLPKSEEAPAPQPNYQQSHQQTYQEIPQQPYGSYPPSAPASPADQNPEVVSTAAFFFLDLLFALPVIGFICVLLFSFIPSINPNLRHFARSRLIWVLIAFVIGLIAVIALIAAGQSIFSAFSEVLPEVGSSYRF